MVTKPPRNRSTPNKNKPHPAAMYEESIVANKRQIDTGGCEGALHMMSGARHTRRGRNVNTEEDVEWQSHGTENWQQVLENRMNSAFCTVQTKATNVHCRDLQLGCLLVPSQFESAMSYASNICRQANHEHMKPQSKIETTNHMATLVAGVVEAIEICLCVRQPCEHAVPKRHLQNTFTHHPNRAPLRHDRAGLQVSPALRRGCLPWKG